MKIVITASGEDLEAQVDPRFGRCQYFIVVDTETLEFEAFPNESMMASGGAGIQAAQTVSNLWAEAVVTGDVGPNAFRTLDAAGIRIFTGANGKVSEVIEKFRNGELNEVRGHTVEGHHGQGGR